ncbi:MAG: glycosyltransferase [Bacteroidetes bacterium]|jgi:glycosyltransferase involved in cell wall biosynthesis|nr:glycosyltransferase [Bacteroidota bacterium]MBT3749632.1 glycosyltransferase [Bacteroidota bacterium]MBT4401042.1 glycosyltransferase [Bacteroidota bacterium]MBT4408590.1 glycosyltransferase [Bacteroidota bacterium]MBT5426492.1 glycosyltransferase [Bacteroidota bacterium]
MITGRDIIVIGIQAWDIEIGSNCKNIAVEMAKNNRVLYVNQPLDRKSQYAEKNTDKVRLRKAVLRGEQAALKKEMDNFWVLNPRTLIESNNWLPDGPLFDWLNRINNNRFAEAIKPALEELKFKDFIIFNDSSMFLGLFQKELLKPDLYIYYMRDYLTKNPYWKKHGVRIEPKLIAKADVVCNNSTLYTEYGLKYNSHSYMVGQGCEVDDFNDDIKDIKVAEDLVEFDKPIIGYVGFLSSRRLSINLLEELAELETKWTFIFVGPEDENFKESRLHQMQNVHFLGSRNPEELPGYIKGFTVCLNPQQVNDATIGNYPRKIDEYLAMGKPTVASSTKAMEYFSDYTYLGVTAEDYQKLIQLALDEDSEEKQKGRKDFARSHTWANNVKSIFEAAENSEK